MSMNIKTINLKTTQNHFGNVKVKIKVNKEPFLKIIREILVKMKQLRNIRYWNSHKMQNHGRSN